MASIVILLLSFLACVPAYADADRLGFEYEEFEGDFGSGDFRAGLLVTKIDSSHSYFSPSHGNLPLRVGDLIVALDAEGIESGEVLEAAELSRRIRSTNPDLSLTLKVQPKLSSSERGYQAYWVRREINEEYAKRLELEKRRVAEVAAAERARLRKLNWPPNAPSEEQALTLLNRDLARVSSVYDWLGQIVSGQRRAATNYYNMKVDEITLSNCQDKENRIVSCSMAVTVTTTATDPITIGIVASLNAVPTRREFQKVVGGWELLPQK